MPYIKSVVQPMIELAELKYVSYSHKITWFIYDFEFPHFLEKHKKNK